MMDPSWPPEHDAPAAHEAPPALLVVSDDLRVLSWGHASEALFGWEASEAVGRPLVDLVELPTGGEWAGLAERARHDGQTHAAMEIRHRDGRWLRLELTWRAVRDERGHLQAFVASRCDAATADFERDGPLVRERHGDVLEPLPDAVLIVNELGSIVFVNARAQQLLRTAATALMGQSLQRVMPGPSGAESLRDRGEGGHEAMARRGDGTEWPVVVTYSPLTMGARCFVLAVLRDAGPGRELERVQLAAQAAERASSEKTRLLTRMSHELRTPLNAVIGFAHLLERGPDRALDDLQRRCVAHILRASRHLLAVVDDLLDMSRIEAGGVALCMEPLQLSTVLDDALHMLEHAADAAQVEVSASVTPADLVVQADGLRLRQVLLNLLSNAIKYNRSQGRVTVRAEAVSDAVAIAVADTGRGLTREQCERLFQPFERLGAEASPIEGTGLGLVIARGLVQRMNGRLGVSSEPGTGSVFTVTLPGAASPQPAAPARPGISP